VSAPPKTEAEESFPEPETAGPDMPEISDPPQTEDESAVDNGPNLLPDLPQAEELIPELPIATESARADS